jgi:hypothetical protein
VIVRKSFLDFSLLTPEPFEIRKNVKTRMSLFLRGSHFGPIRGEAPRGVNFKISTENPILVYIISKVLENVVI